MREAPKHEKISLSKWIARLIRERANDAWPAGVSELVGTWPDAITSENLRTEQGSDIPREPF